MKQCSETVLLGADFFFWISSVCNVSLHVNDAANIFLSFLCLVADSRTPSDGEECLHPKPTLDYRKGTKSGSEKKKPKPVHPASERKELHRCPLCPYVTKFHYRLKNHMLTHSEERRFECALCLTKFRHHHTLKNHMRTHTDEKPYKCELCPYRANTKGALVCHMTNHTGAKQYACGTCSYVTSRSADITKHLRVHTGDRPYKCDLCGYASACQSALYRHTRALHGESWDIARVLRKYFHLSYK